MKERKGINPNNKDGMSMRLTFHKLHVIVS